MQVFITLTQSSLQIFIFFMINQSIIVLFLFLGLKERIFMHLFEKVVNY